MEVLDLQIWLKEAIGFNDEKLCEIPQELMPVFQALREKAERTERKLADVEAMLAFYKASANAMPNPIFIKDDDLRFVFFNRAYREFFGLKEHEYIGKTVEELPYLSQEDRERYHAEDRKIVDSLSILQYETTFQTLDQGESESLYWSKGFFVPETGRRGLIGEIVDISKEKETQRELTRSMQALEVLIKEARDASKIDPITKLFNRNILTDEVPLIISKAEAMGQSICMMLIDIDYFKQINDEYGHSYGDEVLQRFAQILKQSFRQWDIAVRYGGDEFMMLLPGAGLKQAAARAQRLCNTVHSELYLPGGKCVTISVGVAQWKTGDDLRSLISRTDEALYVAKKAGRDGVAVKE